MQFFGGVLLVVFIIVAVLLAILVFIQDDQGEGMGGIFAGGSTTPFGSRSGNVLHRMTATLAVIFFVSALGYGFLNRTRLDSALLEQMALPGAGAANWWEENNVQIIAPEEFIIDTEVVESVTAEEAVTEAAE
ncbi:MAG: preprotein translocase subunit SecG [Spirochaetaceae bacterium]|nr:preprotein translocase subunit SecG [Spirochaetaceae bacterium]